MLLNGLRRWLAHGFTTLSALLPLCALALDHSEVGVLVNAADPLSVQIARYYVAARAIPTENVIEVRFPPGRSIMTLAQFEAIKLQVDLHTPSRVQALVLTWAAPYRVECMSITSAFAFGFDLRYCASGCKPTPPSPYFNSSSRRPFAQLGLRPTIALAAATFQQARALIDRGVVADGTFPRGTAYLLSTSDQARNVRSAFYPGIQRMLAGHLRTRVLQQDALHDQRDVLFYFIGREKVDGLETLGFVPGAIADHLTSFGGALVDSGGQMSALRWLEAGATGSYGTVVEPCNFPQKFPHPAVLIARYLAGECLIEAYWKSVLMPSQGLFIGEPLARPYMRTPLAPG